MLIKNHLGVQKKLLKSLSLSFVYSYFLMFSQQIISLEIIALNSEQQQKSLKKTQIQMSWYSSFSPDTKALDSVLEKRPSLNQLLVCPQFLPQLKLFNPKLLDYLTNSPSLPKEIVTNLVVPPKQTDTEDRKYRLPLLTIEMVQSQTTCIINALFKGCFLEKQQKQVPALIALFYNAFMPNQILPLLAGYFQRSILVLYRIRLKQLTDLVYSYRDVFDLMIKHSYNTAIASILNAFLNIEITKISISSQEKASLKLVTVRKILEKMDIEWRKKETGSSMLIFQNLSCVIKQIVERYCLISDGKAMLEVILEEKHINFIIDVIEKQSDYCYPAMDLVLALIKYYSLSAFNSEQGTEELAKKNMERLQSQYFISRINQRFGYLLNQVKNAKKMTLYYYKLLQVLCHCMTLSSVKMFIKIKQSELYPILIELLFKHQNCNILHKLIERAFLHIFVTDRKIYDLYKRYLFCQISVIDLTLNKILSLFPNNNCLELAMKKAYFGIFMKIVKIYSGIETLDPDIRNAIKSKSQIWNKVSKKFMKPYEQLIKDQLGAMKLNLENTPQKPLDFTIKKVQYNHHIVPIFNKVQDNKAIQQVKKEQQTMPKTLELNSSENKLETFNASKEDLGMANMAVLETLNKIKGAKSENLDEDGFFKVPDSIQQNENFSQNRKSPEKKGDTIKTEQKSLESSNSFSDFMSQKMAEADKQIRMQRSMSGEKRLSAGKRSRMASPSPNRKKNSWKTEDNESSGQNNSTVNNNAKREKISLTRDIPKIPTPALNNSSSNRSQNHLSKSAVQPSNKNSQEEKQETKQISMSMANLESLKHTKIVRINVKPDQKKKYRKVEQKDKPLLLYLGIKC